VHGHIRSIRGRLSMHRDVSRSKIGTIYKHEQKDPPRRGLPPLCTEPTRLLFVHVDTVCGSHKAPGEYAKNESAPLSLLSPFLFVHISILGPLLHVPQAGAFACIAVSSTPTALRRARRDLQSISPQRPHAHSAIPPHQNQEIIHHSSRTTTTITPASFSTATLFPCCTILASRPALPFIDVDSEENTSDCSSPRQLLASLPQTRRAEESGGGVRAREHTGGARTYGVVDDLLAPGIVVDVDGDAAEGGDLGGELGEEAVVLAGMAWSAGLPEIPGRGGAVPLPFVGFGHFRWRMGGVGGWRKMLAFWIGAVGGAEGPVAGKVEAMAALRPVCFECYGASSLTPGRAGKPGRDRCSGSRATRRGPNVKGLQPRKYYPVPRRRR
jgi:hypothetical protein